jgi:hypothetical protein
MSFSLGVKVNQNVVPLLLRIVVFNEVYYHTGTVLAQSRTTGRSRFVLSEKALFIFDFQLSLEN